MTEGVAPAPPSPPDGERTAAAERPMSLRAYGKRRGVTHKAVQVAIDDGRLRESVVTYRGKRAIGDPELADREWSANTRPRIDNLPTGAPGVVPAPPDGAGDLDGLVMPYEEARRRREVELWRQAKVKVAVDELELARLRGELLTVEEVERNLVGVFSQCKNKLLGVPSRARQQDPSMTPPQLELIENLLREALEDLATAGGGE